MGMQTSAGGSDRESFGGACQRGRGAVRSQQAPQNRRLPQGAQRFRIGTRVFLALEEGRRKWRSGRGWNEDLGEAQRRGTPRGTPWVRACLWLGAHAHGCVGG